ncbi:MAG TPA: hypothetical protein VFN87_14060 [Solirubrobacteraceae bacterium]|nr:hypothetical protein [Solirubrobacteraceae bacterium]
MAADWTTISSLATAGGTLVLAVATFSSVKSANRSARVAERSLQVGLRPVLIPSRVDDPTERIRFGDGQALVVPGHGAAVEERDGVIYLAVSVRNGGSGLGVINGWRARPREQGAPGPPNLDEFRRQQLDLYVPAGDPGQWMGAMRDPHEAGYGELRTAIAAGEPIQIDLLYGDHEGGQPTIARFMISPWPPAEDDEPLPEGKRAVVVRYWNVDGGVAG